jgi:pyruvate dehydrogenase E1 component beta subunit
MDFMALALDPIMNQAANWCYMFGGQIGVPIVIRAIINRGGEQGAQHSQALHAFFVHIPGIKVVMPATPEDAKGLLIAAVQDGNPVMYVDDRWLYSLRGPVPKKMYATPLGKAIVRRRGRDVTIVVSSYLVPLALEAADSLEAEGILAEVVDLRTLKPWDKETVAASVAKTGRLIVGDGGWATGGVSSDIVSLMVAREFENLRARPVRVCLPDAPAPTSRSLEQAYYPNARTIAAAARAAMERRPGSHNPQPTADVPGQIVFQ